MVFGMFMAILDIQIVSASLSEIQAGLSASSDEITWVQTSYLIAEVIMIPLSGFLSRAFSTRVIFAVSAGGFTAMSFLCARRPAIDEMIVWRALQGFIGGGMIPTVFASAFTIFPRSKQPIVAPIIGLVATLAPTIGPTVGGYLTDLFSWHWLFLVNIIPGIIVTAAAWLLIDFDEPDYSLLDHFDWVGLATMAAFLGALEYALEEGPSKDWLESEPVTIAIVISAAGAILFFWRVAHRPPADRRPHRLPRPQLLDRLAFAFVLGHRALWPHLHLSRSTWRSVRGYSSLMIGKTMFVTGVCMFVMAPISGRLMTKVDPRLMIAIGFVGFAIGTYAGLVHHRRLGLLGVARAADPARRLADAVHGADQQSGARHHAAAEDQERLGPVQPDAQSRRRGRPGADQHDARQAHGPAPRAAARAVSWGRQVAVDDAFAT